MIMRKIVEWLNNSVLKPIKFVLIIFIVVLVFTMLNPLVVIDAGQRGVVFSKFGGVKDKVLDEGIHFRFPLVESITSIDVRTQKIVFTNNPEKYPDISNVRARLDSASADLQDVYVDTIVTYSLDKAKVSTIYQNVGLDYESKKVIPAIIDSIKTHTAKFKVSEILTNREKIKTNVELQLREAFLKEGLILEGVSLTNFDFNLEFKKSIEEKQIAEQRKEKEIYELERVAIEAQQKVKQAEAIAEAKVKEAEGERQAKILEGEGIEAYNKLIRQQINQDVIDYKKLENELNAINKWNGQYPTYYMGGEGSAIPLLNIGNK
ncbi:prohibitin family protein [Candidatus Gracilibacteria bacterium 28_42_T64]|nr:prohibitin family protein [Candidatus Gracilibacteria bacterium 28_42_T64]